MTRSYESSTQRYLGSVIIITGGWGNSTVSKSSPFRLHLPQAAESADKDKVLVLRYLMQGERTVVAASSHGMEAAIVIYERIPW